MSDFLADERPITEAEFTRRACDPRASVVVEACAGSGKTWLLVSRMVRLLLAGADPGSILAITFTRRAAQEMQARLLDLLRELAQGNDRTVAAALAQRGLEDGEARAAIDPARALYERVLTARVAPTIETFHGWFWRLLSRAPLGAGVPFAPALLEATDRLRVDAWLHFSAALLDERNAPARAAWERLVGDVGEDVGRRLLLQLLQRRAEWWSFAAVDPRPAIDRALAPMRAIAARDPDERVRAPDFVATVASIADLWRSIAAPGKTVADAIDRAQQWLPQPADVAANDFEAASDLVLTRERAPRDALRPERLGRKLASDEARLRYAQLHASALHQLSELRAARGAWRALRLNEAVLTCGALLIDAYQRLKALQQGLDFTDLEWHAHRLLGDGDWAAYMQARLDARYRHILVDEFQDTNPLQWQALQSWLAAYGPSEGTDRSEEAADDRPTVFLVGDPKQSIYRFRRAEPRVFGAAVDLLRRDFRAAHLRTNVTRRNAQAVVDVLNRVLPERNPLYQLQSTRAAAPGAFVLLPLASAAEDADEPEPAALRDVLTVPRAERDSDARYREGRVLANELLHWRRCVEVDAAGGRRSARWSDVLLLVRRRTHLGDYERALRDAGVPFVSDRRGGLLQTLEADDLTALLTVLATPYASLKLAHALRSPLFACGDDDLIRLARTEGEIWWDRLQALPESETGALERARRLLAYWRDLAGLLPVHDLLDRIYHEGDVRRRYAAAVPAALHAQVQANLDAFIELALVIDSGRYPSLPRFIDELVRLKRHALEEAPDEGLADGGDAVRVMTMHGAKGLEAEIVALADANAPPSPDGESVLVVWKPQAGAPEHVSVVARGAAARDVARAGWFDEDDAQRWQEDWNLLYVALTRARQVLIVSGAHAARAVQGTWYERLCSAQDLSRGAAPPEPPAAELGVRTVRDFLPEPLPTGRRTEMPPETPAQRLGRAWHAMLERDGRGDDVVRAQGLSPEQADLALAAAARVRARLPQFFVPAGEAEVDVVAEGGELLRIDRLVETDDALWIVDFKWSVGPAERAAYEAQVRRYAQALRRIRADKPVRTVLVTAEAEVIPVRD